MDRDRVTVQEAASRLGVSEQAIRKRVKRGTIPHDKEADGRVYVYLDGVADEVVTPNSDALISEMRDRIRYLEEESRRKDEIIMQQALTMRQLATPHSPPESSETTTEGEAGTGSTANAPANDTGEPRRSWWQRWFGG
jgi:excisionase family DNA binding protein